MPDVKITPEGLATSAAKYRPDLLKVIFKALGVTLSYFQLRTGIRHSETVGELSGGIEMGPYDESRTDADDVNVKGRTLFTYQGSVIKKFSPNKVAQSIYGSSIVVGDGLKNVTITLQVLSYLSALLGKGLALHVFDAVRKDTGTKTVDLFDGFDTIAAKEITAGNLSVDKGNLFTFSEKIDSTNAVDLLSEFCRAAADELAGYEDGADAKGTQLNLYVPRSVLYAYRDDYKSVTGHTPIYDKFNQTVMEGFENIRFVPMAGKAKSDIIQLSTKQNMLIGTDLVSGLDTLTVEKHHPFQLDFVASIFFGTQYESLSPERLLVGKLKTTAATTTPTTPGTGGATEDQGGGN